MVFERRNVVFNILIDEKTQKNILIMDLMGKRQAPNLGFLTFYRYKYTNFFYKHILFWG